MADILATIPLSAVRVFEAAARLKSFTRAAEELGISQAAVSWQVKALERRLDQTLFLRLPREVVLTPPGERLSRAATEAVNLLRAAVADLTEAGEGVLSITTLQTVAMQWLAPRIGAFQVAHPKLAVRLESSAGLADLMRERLGGLGRPEDLLDAPRIGIAEEWTAWFRAAGVAMPEAAHAEPRLAADTQTLE